MPKVKNIMQGALVQALDSKTEFVIGKKYKNHYQMFNSENDYTNSILFNDKCEIGMCVGSLKVKILKGKKDTKKNRTILKKRRANLEKRIIQMQAYTLYERKEK